MEYLNETAVFSERGNPHHGTCKLQGGSEREKSLQHNRDSEWETLLHRWVLTARRLIERGARRLVLALPPLSQGHYHNVTYKRQGLTGDVPISMTGTSSGGHSYSEGFRLLVG